MKNMFPHQAGELLAGTKMQSTTAKGCFQLSTKHPPSRTGTIFHQKQRAR
jgi:hypothetical protein